MVHYCSQLPSGLIQCLLFASSSPDAKLLGVEYIVSEYTFNTLPDAEKPLWHSHTFEVASAQLACLAFRSKEGKEHKPSQEEEDALAKALFRTYGKTVHTWHPPLADLPLGPPHLMMASTKDNPSPPTEHDIQARDKTYGIDTQASRAHRSEFLDETEQPAQGADDWQKTGLAPEFEIASRKLK